MVATYFETVQLVVKNNIYRIWGSLFKCYSISIIVVLACLGSPNVFAKDLYRLELPEQAAVISLNNLADQSGHSILYSSQDLEGVALKTLKGFYSLPDALDILLKNTHLNAVVTDKRVIVISIAQKNQHQQSSNGESNMNKKNKLSVGILAAIGTFFGIGNATYAQDASQSTALIEEVVVTGVRASIVRSLEQKRSSIGVSDSISAEDIGKFPDLNLSESLQRIPGVTLTRNVNGEGQALNVRGLGPGFTRVEVNGMTGTGNGTSGRFGNTGGGRGFNFELLASELFNNATVTKSNSASEEEGGTASTISLSTPNPLDYQGVKATASLQGNYSEVTGETDPRVAAFVSKNFDDSFGISASLAYSDAFFRTDTVEGGSWRPLGNVAGDPLVANGTRLYNFTESRDTLGSTVTMQFRPSDELDIKVDGIYATSDSERIANRDDMPIEGGQTGVPSTLTVENGLVTSGDFAGVQQRVGTNYFTTDEDFIQLTAKAEWTPNKNWIISPFIGYSNRQAERVRDLYSFRLAEDSDNDGVFDSFDPGTVSYQVRGDFVDFGSNTTNFASNPEDFLFNVFILRPSTDEDEELATKLDFERLINDQGLTSIQFGFRYADRTKNRAEAQTRLQRCGAAESVALSENYDTINTGCTGPASIIDPPTLASVAQLMPYSVSGAQSNLPSEILAANPALVRSVFYPSGNAVAGTWIRPLPGYSAQNSWDIEEETFNAYFQANFEIGAAQFDIGLRLLRTNQTSSGFIVSDQFNTDRERTTTISIDNHYSEYLPSARLRYDLSDDLILRASYSKTLTRVDLNQLAPSESIRGISAVDGGTGGRGNPGLNPFTADNFDLGIEWYFEDEAILSAAYFYKDIQNLVTNTTFTEAREFPEQATGNLVTGDILFSQPVNGNNASVSGLEFSFQKPLFDDFGAIFNYTYTDSKNDVGDAGVIEGISENSYNFSAYYDNGVLDVRISYAWREGYLAQVADDFGTNRFTDDYGQLDLSANYQLADNLQFQFQALNVTQEQRVNQSTELLAPYGVSELDRRVLFGLRYNF